MAHHRNLVMDWDFLPTQKNVSKLKLRVSSNRLPKSWLIGKEYSCQGRRGGRLRFNPSSLLEGQEEPLEEEIATHSSILAWKSPWTEEPGGLQSLGSQRVRHSWAWAKAKRLPLFATKKKNNNGHMIYFICGIKLFPEKREEWWVSWLRPP